MGISDAEKLAEIERTFKLIGQFMSNWSALEEKLSDAVATLLGVDDLVPATVLSVNMGVRDKLNLVRTMLDIEFRDDDEKCKEAAKLLDKIGDRNLDRNLVAHTPYVPHPKGVNFHVVKAKGRFNLPTTVWTTADFLRKAVEMRDLGERLEAIVCDALVIRHDDPEPSPPVGALNPKYLQRTQPQTSLGSALPNPSKGLPPRED